MEVPFLDKRGGLADGYHKALEHASGLLAQPEGP